MLLVIDIGNTHSVIGLYDKEELINYWRIQSDIERTTDELGILIYQLLNNAEIDRKNIKGAIIACVVPPLRHTFQRALQRYFIIEPLFVEPGVKTGMPVLYENPKEVGADRIVNGVAAYEEFKSGVVVVDFGTAITFDCVSPKGEYLGGIIHPGIKISLDALVTQTAKLPKVEILEPKRVVGKTTIESIQSGIFYGFISMVDGVIERLKKELNFEFKVISTGGFASLISNHTKYIEKSDPFLTLKGLKIIYERNQI